MKPLNTFLIALMSLIVWSGPATPRMALADQEDPELVMTNTYDAFGVERKGLTYDFGFSTVVRYRGKTVLFDAGTRADIFAENLATLGIDPRAIDIAILSHGHHDHIGGFDYLLSVNPNVKIYLPNDFFSLGAPIPFPFKGPEPGIVEELPREQRYYGGAREIGTVTSTGRFWKANVEYVTTMKEIMPGVTIIPTNAELMGIFIKYPPNDKAPAFVGMPELSASFTTSKGEALISGCSHSSIESIILETRRVLDRKIHLVAGGFHLIPYDRAHLDGLAKRLRDQYGIEEVAPAHCTGHLAFAILRSAFGDRYRFFGLGASVEVM